MAEAHETCQRHENKILQISRLFVDANSLRRLVHRSSKSEGGSLRAGGFCSDINPQLTAKTYENHKYESINHFPIRRLVRRSSRSEIGSLGEVRARIQQKQTETTKSLVLPSRRLPLFSLLPFVDRYLLPGGAGSQSGAGRMLPELHDSRRLQCASVPDRRYWKHGSWLALAFLEHRHQLQHWHRRWSIGSQHRRFKYRSGRGGVVAQHHGRSEYGRWNQRAHL